MPITIQRMDRSKPISSRPPRTRNRVRGLRRNAVAAEHHRRLGWQEWLLVRRSCIRGFGASPLRFARQLKRTGIMAAGEIDQRFDAAVDRGMGREQVGEVLARI